MKIESCIIVLGSPNTDKGELYSIAKERCDLAMTFYKKYKMGKVILTGGFGDHFNRTKKPHTHYLKSYLLKTDLPEENILACVESSNTLEDASLTKPVIQKYDIKSIIVITSDYHENRARFIFEKEFKELDVSIDFSVSQTVPENCELDLDALKKHEEKALKILMLEENKR